MPIHKPHRNASDEEWAIYYAKKGSKKTSKPESLNFVSKKGVYHRTVAHKKAMRLAQPTLKDKRFIRKGGIRINQRWAMDIDMLRHCCEEATGISTLLTICETPGEPLEVRVARHIEWYMLRHYGKLRHDVIATLYGLKWHHVCWVVRDMELIMASTNISPKAWRKVRIKKMIEKASETPKTIRAMIFIKNTGTA